VDFINQQREMQLKCHQSQLPQQSVARTQVRLRHSSRGARRRLHCSATVEAPVRLAFRYWLLLTGHQRSEVCARLHTHSDAARPMEYVGASIRRSPCGGSLRFVTSLTTLSGSPSGGAVIRVHPEPPLLPGWSLDWHPSRRLISKWHRAVVL